LTVLYWQVGRRISRELLGGDRAAYGEALIAQVAERLTGDYGRGFMYGGDVDGVDANGR